MKCWRHHLVLLVLNPSACADDFPFYQLVSHNSYIKLAMAVHFCSMIDVDPEGWVLVTLAQVSVWNLNLTCRLRISAGHVFARFSWHFLSQVNPLLGPTTIQRHIILYRSQARSNGQWKDKGGRISKNLCQVQNDQNMSVGYLHVRIGSD